MKYYFKQLSIFLLSIVALSTNAQVSTQDSLALVDLYNSTGGSAWVNSSGWLTGSVPTWYGVSVTNNKVRKLNLPANNLSGNVNVSVTSLDSLVTLNMSNNRLETLSNLVSISSLDTLLVGGNKLTFNSLQPNNGIAQHFVYTPQDSVDTAFDTTVIEQSTFVLAVSADTVAGINNQYQWYKNGGLISGATARTYTLLCFDSTMAGTYTCRITNTQLTALTLYKYPVTVIFSRLANAGTDITLCDSISTLIGNAPISGTGTWALIAGSAIIADANAATTSVSQLAPGQNIFRWAITNNALCPTSYDYVVIKRDSIPSLPNASTDIEICTNHVQLNGNTPATGIGMWTITSGTGVIAQPSSPATVVNGLSQGDNILRWQIANGTCAPAIFDEVKIYVADTLQTVNAGYDYSLCPTETNLQAILPLHTAGTWSITSGTGNIAEPNNPVTFVSAMAEGANIFRWTLNNACGQALSDEVTVTVYNFTTADAGADQSIFLSPINPIEVAANAPVGVGGNGVYTYQWSPAQGLNDSTVQHPLFSPGAIGIYSFNVTVTDGNGCTATDALTVEVTQFETLAVPTLITPNNDGVNDNFYMPGVESYPNNKLEIYDRLGRLVYKKEGYVNEFAGISSEGMIYNESVLPQDTYFYTLVLDGDKVQKGFFELKR